MLNFGKILGSRISERLRMDFIPVITPNWSMLSWFIPAALLLGLLKSPWAKRHIGEFLVLFFVHRQLNEYIYRQLHKVTLSTPDGTTQINHVLFSIYDIFVLE